VNKVKLDTGYVTGTKVSQADQEVYIYKGIPYAAPPSETYAGSRHSRRRHGQVSGYAPITVFKHPSTRTLIHLRL
jgi:hypothetical protein